MKDNNYADILIEELYYQRTVMFAVLCNSFYPLAWKARKFISGDEVEGHFIAGIRTPKGIFPILCKNEHWDMFQVIEREYCPAVEEHKDITKLHSLNDDWEEVTDMLAGVSPEDIDYGYDAAEFGV